MANVKVDGTKSSHDFALVLSISHVLEYHTASCIFFFFPNLDSGPEADILLSKFNFFLFGVAIASSTTLE